jgi:hypothetical protein
MIFAEVTGGRDVCDHRARRVAGTLLGGWLTQRSAARARQYEEISRARASLLRLASILVAERAEDDRAVAEAAEQATSGVTLGYGSSTALTLLATLKDWRRFERDSFPRRRARDETLAVLDKMLERSLPRGLRPSRGSFGEQWDLSSATRRPD